MPTRTKVKMYSKDAKGEKLKKKKKVFLEYNGTFLPGYNPVLLARYGLHINVEFCKGSSSYTYMFQYMHKGTDVALYEISEFVEEKCQIRMHKLGRCMTSDESHWDLMGYQHYKLVPNCNTMFFFHPDDKKVECEVGTVPNVKKVCS